MAFKVKNQSLGSDEEATNQAEEEAPRGIIATAPRRATVMQSRSAGLPAQRAGLQQVQIKLLPTEEVEFDPSNPRSGELPDIGKLAASVRAKGLLQPIGVVRNGEHYTCKFGNRRLAAFKRLALDEALPSEERTRFQNIPALVISEGSGEEEAILSNTQIVALSAVDKARAFERLHELKYSDADIGEMFNLTRQMVNSYRNNAEELAQGATIYEVQHRGRGSDKRRLSDNRTGKPQAYWSTALLNKAAKGKLEPPHSEAERGELLQLRTLIDDMLGEAM